MLRVIHFFNIKPGADEAQMRQFVDKLADYTKPYGCIERKVWKLVDATARGEPTQAAAYINEALWPSREASDAFSRAAQSDNQLQEFLTELFNGIDTVQMVRYVDDEG